MPPRRLLHDRYQPLQRRYQRRLHDGLDAVRAWLETQIRAENVLRLGETAPHPRDPQVSRDDFLADLRDRLRDALTDAGGDPGPGHLARRAYEVGLDHARDSLADAGVTAPGAADPAARAHQRGLQRVQDRQQSLLDDIVSDTAAPMAAAVATALAAGWTTTRLFDALTDPLSNVARWRTRLVAHTEVVWAASLATLNALERAGVSGVRIEAEFVTQDDDRVCPICESLHGEVMSIGEARTGRFEYDGDVYPKRPPLHPQCRCILAPVVV